MKRQKLTMRLMPFADTGTLKLISSPRRLPARRRREQLSVMDRQDRFHRFQLNNDRVLDKEVDSVFHDNWCL